jgi:hypothetical protein
MGDEPKTIRAEDCAKRTGMTARTFQLMFHSGKIDWASQPGGPGTTIFFDEAGFEAWRQGGRKKRSGKTWQTSTGAVASRMRARRTKAWKSENPLRQHLLEKQKSVSKSG